MRSNNTSKRLGKKKGVDSAKALSPRGKRVRSPEINRGRDP